MILRSVLMAIAALCLYLPTLRAQDLSRPPAQTVPEFRFFRFDNTPFTDKDLPHGKMLFFIFMDPDCDHCQKAIGRIGDQYDVFKNTAIYLVSEYAKERVNHFMDTYGAKLKGKKNVTLLIDKQQQFIMKFNPRRYPSMLIYSGDRKLLDYEDNPESVFRLVNTVHKASK